MIAKTIQEAVKEIQNQLLQKDFYLHNYKLLDGVECYLDGCTDENDEESD